MPELFDVTIARVGAQGDGVAEAGGAQLFVPFALAGERLRIDVAGGDARIVEVLSASADRVAPVCRHFGACGGCAVQHMAAAAYRTWKRDLVTAAFRSRGLEATIGDLVSPKGRRRRAVLSARNGPCGVTLGLHEAGSHRLVDVVECPVLSPAIVAALPGIRRLVAPLMPKSDPARVVVTATDGGLDVALEDIQKQLSAAALSRLAQDATQMRAARVSIKGAPAYEAAPPTLTFGRAELIVPPGAFIQAVGEAEQVMGELILAAIGKAKSVVDLFCGVGAFTFRLSEKWRVAAFDSDARSIEALSLAVRRASGLKPIEARVRDLFREPLSARELNDYNAVIFDPPRAGAEAQARMIAKSTVPTVVAVSCNAATLARDARILVDGGYDIESVTPIDQFLYSPHVEVVAVFRRDASSPRRRVTKSGTTTVAGP